MEVMSPNRSHLASQVHWQVPVRALPDWSQLKEAIEDVQRWMHRPVKELAALMDENVPVVLRRRVKTVVPANLAS